MVVCRFLPDYFPERMNNMPVGVITCCLAVFFGALVGGTLLKKAVPQFLKDNLPVMFGYCSLAVGINSVVKAHNMSVVVLAVLSGFCIGQLVHLQELTTRFSRWLVTFLHLGGKDVDMNTYITMVAIFCCSGFGWYGVMTEGITGDPGLLLSKSIMDFFTALVFATALGVSLCAIPLPQFIIFLGIFGISKLIAPALTPEMFADLSGCGGVLSFGAALRVAKIKDAPIVDMMPALILVMPLSALWTAILG